MSRIVATLLPVCLILGISTTSADPVDDVFATVEHRDPRDVLSECVYGPYPALEDKILCIRKEYDETNQVAACFAPGLDPKHLTPDLPSRIDLTTWQISHIVGTGQDGRGQVSPGYITLKLSVQSPVQCSAGTISQL